MARLFDAENGLRGGLKDKGEDGRGTRGGSNDVPPVFAGEGS